MDAVLPAKLPSWRFKQVTQDGSALSEQRVVSQADFKPFGDGVSPSAKDQRRAALFRETPLATARRVTFGVLWALKPQRWRNLLPLTRLWLKDMFGRTQGLRGVEDPPANSELAGMAHDLSVPVLVEAYRRGLFPHSHVGPAKWLLPEERGVLELADFRIPSRMRNVLRRTHYRVSFDEDFEGVITGCAAPRPGKWPLTWITPRIMKAYARMFDEGHVHSFEVWNERGELAGGGYGVVVGRVFVMESMFFTESNASKVGILVLAWHLAHWGFVLFDNKWLTPAVARLGFKEIPREAYAARLAQLADEAVGPERWQVEADPKTVVEKPPV